jgi:hypothetical protein
MLKIASHELFHKKSFMFPIRGGNMDCFILSTKDFFMNKVHERLFLALFAVYTGVKKNENL